VVPLASRRRDVPPELAAVVERALAKPREDRWQSAASFEAALSSAKLEAPAHPSSKWRTAQASEQRVVAILFADGVTALDEIQRAVEARGGATIPLIGERALGVFGGDAWEGDEVVRAATAALESRSAARRMAIASGRATVSGKGVSGSALRAA